jgi:hypothetical protein
MLSKRVGQALTEYGIIGGAVFAVVLVSLSPLGHNIGDLFSNMVSPPPKNINLANSGSGINVEVIGKKPSESSNNNTGSTGLNGGPYDYSGDPNSATSIPKDLPGYIQTAGANGTTELFANQIRNAAKQLLADGKITQEQANNYYELANQGSRIATMEKLIEDGVAHGTKTVTFEGKTYTPFELSRKLGWPDEPANYYGTSIQTAEDALNRAPESRSETMQSFLDSYVKLKNSGAMGDPNIKNLVSALSAKISYLSEIIESNVSDQHWGNTQTSLKSYMASQTSYWHSSQICNVGGGKNTGVRCQ